MGGAVGHLYHTYDDLELTFSELKSILNSAASGELQNVTEKLDGMNLVFSWNNSKGELKIARNSGDIKSGGMSPEGLANKFAGRGVIEEAFGNAGKILNSAIQSMPEDARLEVFGETANKWYSIEVIYPSAANVINYDSNAIVFHGWPVFEVDYQLNDVYTIYSDDVDITKNYPDKYVSKSAPDLFASGKIKLRGVNRNETVNVSGTQMRAHLTNGDMSSFVALLPPSFSKKEKEDVWNTLHKIKNEGILRRYISFILRG